MEIALIGFLILMAIVGWFGEETKLGKRFFRWFGLKFIGIDIDDYPED